MDLKFAYPVVMATETRHLIIQPAVTSSDIFSNLNCYAVTSILPLSPLPLT